MVHGREKISSKARDRILLSKLIKPEISGGLVSRAVFGEFGENLLSGMKVGLVVAPAGYGKSTLLSQSYDMLSHRGARCAWISLDRDDNDPLRLLSYILAVVNSMNPIDSKGGAEYFGVRSKVRTDSLEADIIGKLEALDFKHALFLDDYHVISNPEVHGILERLILYSPRNTIIVLASRTEPNLAFKTLRVRGEVCQLSAEDLSFAQDEIDHFLNGVKHLGLDNSLIAALASKTEGWVAGLQLVSLALSGGTDAEVFIQAFSGTDRDVTDYLGETVLDQQSEDIQRFLLWTSLLDRMNAEMVNTVLGIESAQSMLEHLEERNLFVIPLDRDRNWFRYHHLFRDFLKVKLLKKYENAERDIYQRAADWCSEKGLQHEAINYALSGGIYDQAIELIADIVEDLIEVSGEHWTLLYWVKQLPDDYSLKQPRIAVFHSWSLIFSGQHTEAREVLQIVDAYCKSEVTQIAPEELKTLRSKIDLMFCMVELGFDNTELSSELTKKFFINHPDADPRDALTACVFQAYIAMSTFETDLGEAAGDKAVVLGEEHGIDYLEAWARSVAGLMKVQRADLNGAANHYRKGLVYNNRQSSSNSYMGNLNTVFLAEVCYEQNDLVQAELLLQDRFEYIDNEAVVDVAYVGYRTLAKLQFLRVGLDAGLNVLRLGQESAIRAKLPRLRVMLSALEIHSLLRAGKSKEAEKIAKENGCDKSQWLSFSQRSRPVVQEIHKLIQAALSLDNNLPKQALSLLNELVLRAEGSGRQRLLIDLFMLRSRAFQKLRRLDESKIDLLSALNIGAKGGFCRVFLDAGEEIHSLLRLLIKNSSGDIPSGTIELLGKINKLLLVDHTSEVNDAPQFKPSAALLETLTKREMQMLDTIVTGQTNKEIADKLFISEQTVKWHLHQLYQKLGVRNRTSAIAKARTLALI